MPSVKTRTLEDVLVSAIQGAPRQPFSKLALADLLTEKGLDSQAGVLRWCARTRRWPQRLAGVTGNAYWQWWHPSISRRVRIPLTGLFRGYRIQPPAILPRELLSCWPPRQIWSANTWLGALELLVAPLASSSLLVPDGGGVVASTAAPPPGYDCLVGE